MRVANIRGKGFTQAEAEAILSAASSYVAPSRRELPETSAAKRWTPWLAAYTGARITELTQLRSEDVTERDGIPFIAITPDAGSVKTNERREVPIHQHLLELGFVDFARRGRGPLFYRENDGSSTRHPARTVSDRVGSWVRSLKVTEGRVQPNHGWRHRFKTVGREVGIEHTVLDAIQGHAPRTSGEKYGSVTLVTKRNAIKRIPRYTIAIPPAGSDLDRQGSSPAR